MLDRLAIVGMGDLTRRLLLPSLARLLEAGRLPDRFEILAVDREERADDAFREELGASLEQHAGDVGRAARDELLSRVHARTADAGDAERLKVALEPQSGPLAVYLALPPSIFEAAILALAEVALPPRSRVVVEKPFGEGLDSARRLNALLAQCLSEEAVHRMDHFLGKQTVQNVLGLRFANRVFEPLWNRHHIAKVEIIWDEDLTLEGRAGYYDQAGALRDMVQNHLLQLLALVAMEAPAELNDRDLRNRKVDILRSVEPLDRAAVAERTVRARYRAGRIGDREVPDYIDEPGVDPHRETETFAAVTLFVNNWRWAGVPFQLRSGKALSGNRHEIAVHFQPVPHVAFPADQEPRRNVLRMALDPDVISLEMTVNGAGDPFTLEDADLSAELAPQEVPAYSRLVLDILEGDATFSIRGDEAEEAWRIVEPILQGWAEGTTPMRDYQAGSAGPTTGFVAAHCP